jgi:hypothetical protein
MKQTVLVFACGLALTGGAAQAEIYKCEGPDGRLQFSDKPCEGAPSEEVQVDYIEPTAEQRAMTQRTHQAQDRMIEEAEHQRAVKAVRARISRLQDERGAELAALRHKKRYAANNLAGATWENSISEEMKAVAQRYNADIQAARDELAELQGGGE